MQQADIDEKAAAELADAESLSILAHELRTPLSALRVSFDLLRDPDTADTDTAEHRRLVDTMDRSIQRLERQVTDLLEVGYLNSGALALRLERVDIESPIAAALEMVRQQVVQRRIIIDLVLPESLPPLNADPVRVEQVLTNLLTNAIKFSPLGGSVTIDISIGEESKGATDGAPVQDPPANPMMVISVTDQGPGIESQYRDRVFLPFYQIRRASDRSGGAGVGLGLPIARSLVEMHGGRMWVADADASGTTMRFTMPIGQDDEGSGS